MAARSKMIEKELNNRMNAISWSDVVDAIAALTPVERDSCLADIRHNNGNFRNILWQQIRQNIKTLVAIEVDGYIAAETVPIAFLNKLLDD